MSFLPASRARVVVVSTHPVQYHVPWLRGLAAHPRIDLHVLYGLLPTAQQQGVGFGVAFQWDQDLLEGYRWSVLENRAATPSLGRWAGVDTPAVGSHLARLRPDVVVVCGWQAKSLVQATIASWRQEIPLLVRGDSNALRKRRPWVRAMQRMYLQCMAGVLVVGNSNREFYQGVGLSEDRMKWAPHFVPKDHLTCGNEGWAGLREMARVRWALGQESVVVAFVGKFQPKKRPMDLVQAAARLKQDVPHLHLLLVGSGELEEHVREQARELDVPCAFTGFLNQREIATAYAAADMLVLPSDHGETWGLVVNEAQVCSLPVIVSDQVGCGPDLVEDGVTGWTYPCGDVAALADRIRRLAADPAARERMGQAGRQRVEAYSVEAAVDGTVQAIEVVLARRGVRTGERV